MTRFHISTALTLSALCLCPAGCDMAPVGDDGVSPAAADSPESKAIAKPSRSPGQTSMSIMLSNGDQETDPGLIRQLAQRKIDSLSTLPAEYSKAIGFRANELGQLQLGEPYHVLKLDNRGELSDLKVWEIPVLVDNTYRSLITVRRRGDRLTVASIGSAGLASDLQAIEQEVRDRSPSKRRTILRQFHDRADFLVLGDKACTERSDCQVIPFDSARRAYQGQLATHGSPDSPDSLPRPQLASSELARIVRNQERTPQP